MAENKKKEEITCPICHKYYTDAKVLPCCHYFCKECIHRLAWKTGFNEPFSCPRCCKETSLPQGGVDNLPAAFFTNRLMELNSKLERVHTGKDIRCELCTRLNKAKAFCRQCSELICEKCVEAHRRMKKSFNGHKIVSFDELRRFCREDILMNAMFPYRSCKKHQQLMKIYCFDCDSLVCNECAIETHFGHKYEYIKEAGPNARHMLSQKLSLLKEVKANLSRTVDEIQIIKSDIRAQGTFVVRDIENSLEKLILFIKEYKRTLLEQVYAVTAEKMVNLSNQETHFTADILAIQNMIKHSEQSIEQLTDNDIIHIQAEMQDRMNKQLEQCHTMYPVEEVDLGLEVCLEDILEFLQAKAKIIKLPVDPSKCVISGKREERVEVNKMAESKFFLKNKMPNGKETRQKCAITCFLKSLVDGCIVKCDFDHIQGNEYRIQYELTLRGPHKVIITVNGHEVSNILSIFATISLVNLGNNPVKTIKTESENPFFITVNSIGEILATGSSTLNKYHQKGVLMNRIKLFTYGITAPGGVAVGSSDCIYIADSERRKIIKLNKEMELLNAFSNNDNSKLLGMTVAGEEVMVCDTESMSIQVYSTELRYRRKIGSKGKGPLEFRGIRDMCSDGEGKIYVSDSGNSRIQVLTSGGEFLRSFSCNGGSPWGICVVGRHLLVADYDDSNVHVYSTEGQLLSVFGKSFLTSPTGVCVDRDVFVYVCDRWNRRIQVF